MKRRFLPGLKAGIHAATLMIEEYARHNGHADLLRERLDGSTGEWARDAAS